MQCNNDGNYFFVEKKTGVFYKNKVYRT